MDDVILQLVSKLRDRRQTVGFAESCTGGLLSAQMVKHAGISDVYKGGVVAYDNQLKIDALHVPTHLLHSIGAVSLPVAKAMAQGAKALTKATWAVSITGIAGPEGGTDRKPVGTVCFGIAGPGIEKAVQQHFAGHRNEVQRSSAEFAVRWLLETL